MKPPEQIETERLILRIPRMEDVPAIFEGWAQDPEVTRFLTWRPHKQVGETQWVIRKAIIAWEGDARFPYMLQFKEGGGLAGMMDLRIMIPRVNLGYVVARPHWGKGYMTEAVRAVIDWSLQQPIIHRVEATTDVENAASCRVMEKAGMTREGTLRKYILHPSLGNEPRDSFMYAIVK